MKNKFILICLLLGGYTANCQNDVGQSFWNRLFTPSPQFENATTLLVSYGLTSNANVIPDEVTTIVPPLTLTIQGHRQRNLGTFLSLSAHT